MSMVSKMISWRCEAVRVHDQTGSGWRWTLYGVLDGTPYKWRSGRTYTAQGARFAAWRRWKKLLREDGKPSTKKTRVVWKF